MRHALIMLGGNNNAWRTAQVEICKSFKINSPAHCGGRRAGGAGYGAGNSRGLSAVIVWTSFYVPTISHYKNYGASSGQKAGQQTSAMPSLPMRWWAGARRGWGKRGRWKERRMLGDAGQTVREKVANCCCCCRQRRHDKQVCINVNCHAREICFLFRSVPFRSTLRQVIYCQQQPVAKTLCLNY